MPRHDHAHSQAQSNESFGPPAQPRFANGQLLLLDAFSGVSGDMINSALLDLGAPLSVAQDAVQALGVQGVHLQQSRRERSGISGAAFEVVVDQPQPERTWSSIDALLAASPLEAPVRNLARRIFERLGRAEAAVHHIPIEQVHFHEVGAADAIADVVGAASLLHWIGADTIVCSPIPIGHGLVRARHGVLPLPAPAALECLKGVPTYGVDVDAELVTPTGAAIIATIAQRFERWPAMIPMRIGFGTGQRELPDRPNLLRIVVGKPITEAIAFDPGATHVVIETNIDDMTGELAAHVIEQLVGIGALDVWVTPSTAKKGRPAWTLSVLAERERSEAIVQTLLRETTTIGVRIHGVQRITRPRRMVEVHTRFGTVPVKVAAGDFGPEQAKPEFDACVKLAREAGAPVREVIAEAMAAWRRMDPR